MHSQLEQPLQEISAQWRCTQISNLSRVCTNKLVIKQAIEHSAVQIIRSHVDGHTLNILIVCSEYYSEKTREP